MSVKQYNISDVKQLREVMKILENFFYKKCINSDEIVETSDDRGWYYMKESAKQLKRELIKYKMREQ
jgi:hypothetical protein